MEARPSRIPLLQENPRPRHRHRDLWLAEWHPPS